MADKKKIPGQKFKNEFSWSEKKKRKKEKEKSHPMRQKTKAKTSNTSLMNELSLL